MPFNREKGIPADRAETPSQCYFGSNVMKRIWVILILLCVCLVQSGCEEQTATPRQLSPDWFTRGNWPTNQPDMGASRRAEPRIVFEKVTHNFGNVGPVTNHLCEFRFRNAGTGILKIDEVSRICGCTPFLLDKRQYAPGEIGTLKVRYYAETELGPITKQLYVHSNDRTNPEVTLSIQANVMSKVDYEPKTLNLLLGKNNAGCPTITIASIDNRPFSIKHFRSTDNSITADFNPSTTATRFVLQPQVDMSKLQTIQEGRIEIGLTHPECDSITVGVNTVPKFRITPRSIVVSGAEPRKPILKKVRILHNYNEDFELESAYSNKNLVKVVGNSRIRDGYELELEITPPDSGGKSRIFTEVFSLKTKSGDMLEIPCSGFYSSSAVPSNRSTTKMTRGQSGSFTPEGSIANSKDEEDCPTCGIKQYNFNPETKKSSLKLVKPE
jgi:hypothetical protein